MLDLPYTALGAASFEGAETGAALIEQLVTICAKLAAHFARKTS